MKEEKTTFSSLFTTYESFKSADYTWKASVDKLLNKHLYKMMIWISEAKWIKFLSKVKINLYTSFFVQLPYLTFL